MKHESGMKVKVNLPGHARHGQTGRVLANAGPWVHLKYDADGYEEHHRPTDLEIVEKPPAPAPVAAADGP